VHAPSDLAEAAVIQPASFDFEAIYIVSAENMTQDQATTLANSIR
jgi:hypothetical protein